LQLLVPPAVRKFRWKKGNLQPGKPFQALAQAAEPLALAVLPAPDSSEGGTEVASELPGSSNRAEEVLRWLQALPKELQLVEWLGRHNFLDRLCPCDILCLVTAQERYMEKHSCQETLRFDLIGA
jgi:hypothetical protein